MDLNIQTIMEKVVQSFMPEKAAGVDAKIQFQMTGDQAQNWVATIRDQKLAIEPGMTTNPNLSFSADQKDILDVFTGKLNPMQAYMQGKIKFTGDTNLAMRLAGMFRKPK